MVVLMGCGAGIGTARTAQLGTGPKVMASQGNGIALKASSAQPAAIIALIIQGSFHQGPDSLPDRGAP